MANYKLSNVAYTDKIDLVTQMMAADMNAVQDEIAYVEEVLGGITEKSLDINGTLNANLLTSDGAISAAAGVSAGTGLIVTAGNLVVSEGTITVSGNITAQGASTITAGTGGFIGKGAIWIYSRNYSSHILPSDTTGNDNTVFGYQAGLALTTGLANVAIGKDTGKLLTTGIRNVLLGSGTGQSLVTGERNTFLGYGAGANSTGSSNVFIGEQAGGSETGSNKLYIANSSTNTPLIYGTFPNTLVQLNASVKLGRATDSVGFYGSAGDLKPVITGRRDIASGFVSLLDHLETLGLLTV